MSTMQIFNAKSQTVEDAEMTVDANNEIVATFEDGGIVKFPAGLAQDEFDALITAHKETNTGQEIITPETEAKKAAERNASLELIGETPTDNTMSEEDTTNVAPDQPSE